MKKCPHCGKEYPDEATVCVIDNQPLKSFPLTPEPAAAASNDEFDIVTIETFSSINAADIAAARLGACGIECWIKADDAGGMYPPLAMAGGVRLQVRTPDAERAVAVLKTEAPLPETFNSETIAENAPSEKPSPKFKLAIGQILVSIVIGVLLTHFYQWGEKRGTKTFYHHTANRQVDEMWIYQDGQLVEFRQDRNLDGKWDHRVYYEHGRVVRSEYNNDFGGKPNEWWTFSENGKDTSQIDTDFNGIPDEFWTYKNRIAQEMEIRPNGSKFAITKEKFSNGVLTEIWRGGDSNGKFKEVVRFDPFFNPISTNPFPLQSALK
ncbi:MAG: hypothetical protein WCH99_20155 [Verrucomicrobiota bacterium]